MVLSASVATCSKTDTPTDPGDPVSAVAVTPGTSTLTSIGASVQLIASATRGSGAAVTGATFQWSSADAAVVSVSASGLVTAVGVVSATVSATHEAVVGSAMVTVGLLANTVTVTPAEATLIAVSGSVQLSVEARDAGGALIGSPAGAWASSVPGVATVSTTGLVVAVANGTTVVTYTLDSATDSAVITVAIPVPGAALWETEESRGSSQRGIWASAANDYWSVGSFGSIMHFDGVAWSDVTPGVTGEVLEDVWGSAADDIWAVGWNGTILHYDGTQWSDASGVTSEHLRGVWGTGASDVWAVGGTAANSQVILHYDGSSWSQQSPGSSSQLISISGTATDDVFAVGAFGHIVHFDGVSWTRMSTGRSDLLWAVWASAADDVWVATASTINPVFLHYDGVGWSVEAVPGSSFAYRDFWGTAPDDVWAVTPGFQFSAGAMIHWDGASWTDTTPPAIDLDEFASVWGTASDDVVVTGQWGDGGGMTSFQWDGLSWTERRTAVLGKKGQIMLGVWGAAPDDVWAVSSRHGIAHFDGSSWVDETLLADPSSLLLGVWGSAADDVWAVGSGAPAGGFANQILRYDGVAWADANPGLRAVATYRGIWGSSASDVWAVGNDSEIIHYDGVSWSDMSLAINVGILHHVWGSGPDDVWAVGEDGGSKVILHWDGTMWSDESPGLAGWLRGVWGTGPSDVWATGSAGSPLLHFDGTQWSEVTSVSSSLDLYGVYGSGPGDVWAVGGSTILRYDGSTWTDMSPVLTPSFFLDSVWMPTGDPNGLIWAVGGATILRGTR